MKTIIFWRLLFISNKNICTATDLEQLTSDSSVLVANGEALYKTKAVDMVIEQGTSGVYTYRKWSSGVYELWGKIALSPTANNGGDVRNTTYYCDYLLNTNINANVDFPFAFKETPYCVANINDPSTYISQCFVVATSTTMNRFLFARGNNDFYNTTVDVYLKGTWK